MDWVVENLRWDNIWRGCDARVLRFTKNMGIPSCLRGSTRGWTSTGMYYLSTSFSILISIPESNASSTTEKISESNDFANWIWENPSKVGQSCMWCLFFPNAFLGLGLVWDILLIFRSLISSNVWHTTW